MDMIITNACFLTALALLIILGVIDLKTRLLPNKYVAAFLAIGLIFNIANGFYYTQWQEMLIGMIAGAGLLLAIRYVANKIYKQDTLGLGDVKLMGAAGIWLGVDYIFLCISIGAFAGLIHGLGYGMQQKIRTGEKINLSKLSIPAGPGFILGIIITAFLKFVLDIL